MCVPSESDRRNNLAEAIAAMDANLALLTPSIARLLEPRTVPCLKVLVLAGEQVTAEDWMRWQDRVQIINGYGPRRPACSVSRSPAHQLLS